jgi:hypothetical protein
MIAGFATLSVQALTMAQIHRNRKHSDTVADADRTKNEAFQNDQRKMTEEHARKLAALEADLKQLNVLRTRWDPVRFEIYVDVVVLAMKRFELLTLREGVMRRYKVNKEDLADGRINQKEYLRNDASITADREPIAEESSKCREDWNFIRGKGRMLASPPVWEALNELGDVLLRMESDGHDNLLWEYNQRLEGFRDAVRVELGSDHYAEEPLSGD